MVDKAQEAATRAYTGVKDDDSHFQNNTKNPEANKSCPNNNPFIEAWGRKWWINYHWSPDNGTYCWEPFRSIFNPKIIQVKSPNEVQLWIKNKGIVDRCETSEIVLAESLGYGKYLVTARADNGDFSQLDPRAVLGLFTYQYSEATSFQMNPHTINLHRELDALEIISPDQRQKGKGQFTLQPYNGTNETVHKFDIRPNSAYVTVMMDWNWYWAESHATVTFNLYYGNYSMSQLPPRADEQWDLQGFSQYIPSHAEGCERFHINLWLMHGLPPAKDQSVTITRFEFEKN